MWRAPDIIFKAVLEEFATPLMAFICVLERGGAASPTTSNRRLGVTKEKLFVTVQNFCPGANRLYKLENLTDLQGPMHAQKPLLSREGAQNLIQPAPSLKTSPPGQAESAVGSQLHGSNLLLSRVNAHLSQTTTCSLRGPWGLTLTPSNSIGGRTTLREPAGAVIRRSAGAFSGSVRGH